MKKHYLIFLLAILNSSHGWASNWSVSTVKTLDSATFSPNTFMAAGPNGYPQMIYKNNTIGFLGYAKWTGAGWSIMDYFVGATNYRNGIGIDPNGKVAMSYIIGTSLYCAIETSPGSGLFNYYAVDSAAAFSDNAIAIGPNGYPQIAYTDVTNKDLKYAKWNGSSWSTETVESSGDLGRYPSIAVDSNNYAHIVHRAGDLGVGMHHARWTGGSWVITSVDTTSIGEMSIKIGTNNYPYIAYQDRTARLLKYAKWNGSAFTIETVDPSPTGATSWVSMALDSNNGAAISYQGTGGIRYAHWNGSGWDIEVVDAGSGTYTAVAINANGCPYLSYFKAATYEIKFAKMQGSPALAWTGEAGYTADGVSPDVDQSSTPYTFRINYKDFGLEAPLAGYPRVVIKKGAAPVMTLPMNFVSGNYLNGAIYSTAALLPPSSDYTYSIEGLNAIGYAATPQAGVGPGVRAYLSGTIRDAAGAAMGSVTVSLTGSGAASLLTASDGAYLFSGLPAGGNYTVMPASAAYYSFTPVSRSAAAIADNISSWDFARNNTPAVVAWTGEAGYTADGVSPDSGPPENPFTFRVKYIDAENDAPADGYPKLHIKKGGAEIAGSPFTMAAVDANTFIVGRVFAYSKTLPIGNDYTYYMEVQDAQNGVVAATSELSGPNVGHQPVLAWTGEAGYTADGVNPDTGTISNTYTFQTKYTDPDGLAPAGGYPKVHVYRAGAEIAGSPLSMSYVSGNPGTGSIYSYQTTLSIGMAYTYTFEAQNQYLFAAAGIGGNGPQVRTKISGYVKDPGNNALGDVTMTLAGAENRVYNTGADGYYEFFITTEAYTVTPSSYVYFTFTPVSRVYSNNQTDLLAENYLRDALAPVLSWTGEAGYTADGVSPDVDQSSVPYTFKITYASEGGDAPLAGYPRVVIKKASVIVMTLPLNFESGSYQAGVVYSTATLLAPCSYYTYSFEAKDAFGATAAPKTGSGPNVGLSISGTVRDAVGLPMADVAVALSGDDSRTFKTGVDGNYSFNRLNVGGNYAIAPTSAAYLSFTPVNKSTAGMVGDITAWDFARNNTGAAVTWTGEAGYAADGVSPDSGFPENPFTFRIKYIDAENDAPAAGYPKLHIKKGGAEISGSPFTMSAADLNAFTFGRVFSFDKTLSAMGADYIYYIEARDAQNGAVAVTSELSGPGVAHQPALAWTGEAGYSAVGVNPSTGIAGNPFTFRVKYTDLDGLAPTGGYPRVHIYRAGAEIAGSPFTMSYVSGAPNTGSLYTYQTNFSIGMAYTYSFEAQNQYLFAAAGIGGNGPQVRTKVSGHVKDLGSNPLSDVTMTLAGAESKIYKTAMDGYFEFFITTETYTVTPSSFVYYTFTPVNRSYTNNQADLADENYSRDALGPVLAWTGETGYTADGVSPDVDQSSVPYTFRVSYSHGNNDAPASGYPRVLIKRGTAVVQTLPMNYINGAYLTGAVYSTAALLAPCSFYTYTFEGRDIFNNPAIDKSGSGPDVLGSVAGVVRNVDGLPMADVTVALSGADSRTFKTGADGAYSFNRLSVGGRYAITPTSAAYYSFAPVSAAIVSAGDLAGINFQRNNAPPALSWPAEANYAALGVYPSTGATGTDTFVFKVFYKDPDDESFHSLKLFLKKDGIIVSTIPIVDCGGGNATGLTCSYGTIISTSGFYTYQFNAIGAWGESLLTPELQFLVDLPPSAATPDISVITDNQAVVSSEVTLKWSAVDPEGGPLTYDLYVSLTAVQILSANKITGVSAAALVYSGPNTSYVLRDLSPGRPYYWKVNVTNQYGVTTEGTLMKFLTLSLPIGKMFNYPNPFNPTRQQTNIVFSVNAPQTVKVRIYSEYGDLLRTLETRASAGTNELRFDGRDKNGRLLFNGSYIAMIERAEGVSKCYILIIK